MDLMTLDVESLLGELVAWINDPNDTSGSGQGEGWKEFQWWVDYGELPTRMGKVLEALRTKESDTELRRIQPLLAETPEQFAQVKAAIIEKWGELPARDMQRMVRSKFKIDLSEFYLSRLDTHIGHYEVQPIGEFKGIAALVNFVLDLPILPGQQE